MVTGGEAMGQFLHSLSRKGKFGVTSTISLKHLFRVLYQLARPGL